MADKIIMTCGDCIHADVCEEAETLVGFSRENIAYCGMFLNAADVVEVVRCKNCAFYEENEAAHTTLCRRGLGRLFARPDGYCSYGERRDHNGDS